MIQGDMNSVMCDVLKMVEYNVQIIIFSQIFHDFYTYLSGQLCKMPKSFNGQRYTDAVYIALLKTSFWCTFVASKSYRSTEAVLLHPLIVCLQKNQI